MHVKSIFFPTGGVVGRPPPTQKLKTSCAQMSLVAEQVAEPCPADLWKRNCSPLARESAAGEVSILVGARLQCVVKPYALVDWQSLSSQPSPLDFVQECPHRNI